MRRRGASSRCARCDKRRARPRPRFASAAAASSSARMAPVKIASIVPGDSLTEPRFVISRSRDLKKKKHLNAYTRSRYSPRRAPLSRQASSPRSPRVPHRRQKERDKNYLHGNDNLVPLSYRSALFLDGPSRYTKETGCARFLVSRANYDVRESADRKNERYRGNFGAATRRRQNRGALSKAVKRQKYSVDRYYARRRETELVNGRLLDVYGT